MQLQLTNGKQRYVPWGGATYGYHVDSITLDYHDMCKLVCMDRDKLLDYLGVLYTRFPPTPEQHHGDKT